MKRICIVIGCWMGGGCESVVANLAEELNNLGHKVDILSLEKPTHPNKSKKVKLHYIEIDSPRKCKRFKYRIFKKFSKFNFISSRYPIHKYMYELQHKNNIKILKEAIEKLGGYDMTISHLSIADFLCIVAELPNHYVCMHGEYVTDSLMNRNMYSKTNIIAISEKACQDLLSSGIKTLSVNKIYNIFNFDEIINKSNEFQIDEEDYIVFLGRLDPLKNIPLLIDAYSHSGIKQKLLIIGDGELEETIKQKIKKDGLEDKVILKRYAPNPYPYIKGAKALVLSSNLDSFPTVIIESLIIGTPVASTACAGPQEIMQDELAEFLSPIGDVGALAKNLQKVISHPPKILNKHIAKFSHEVNLPKYLALIDD